MDFTEHQRRPTKHLTGFGIVVLLHLLLGWALVSGLARRVVEVIKAPVEVSILPEAKPTPPPPPPPEPPPKRTPPPRKAAPPPPSYVPPPEVSVAPSPEPAPTITTTQVVPPPAPAVSAPAPAAPAPRPTGTAARIDVSSCEKPEYPRAALRAEAIGTTRIRFTIDATGRVSKAEIERPSGPTREHRSLDAAAVEVLSKCPFRPGTDAEGRPVGGAVTTVDYVWKLE
ncbi:energy transducer TonB [Variovorax sp. E3]|jgi:protein TonB|uniref:energy transducer TonB n=1 Tax=Variovorax sp. E3 TaxID=1914993 RepID=UPI0018DE1C03|nr:energy transducer TonB [Variovorax sp. E3]